jgi:hypothetical protein
MQARGIELVAVTWCRPKVIKVNPFENWLNLQWKHSSLPAARQFTRDC